MAFNVSSLSGLQMNDVLVRR